MPKEPVLYEAMYILDASLSDEQIAAVEDRLRAGLESFGAQVVSVHEFGRRRLAYEIKGHTQGIYRVMYFRGHGPAVDEIKHEFQLSEEIIRGMVVVANPLFILGERSPVQPEGEPEEAAEGEVEALEVATEPAEAESEEEEAAEEEAPSEEAED